MGIQINPNVTGALAIFFGAIDGIAQGKLPLPNYLPPEWIDVIIETDKFLVGWWNLFLLPLLCFLSSPGTGFLAPKPPVQK